MKKLFLLLIAGAVVYFGYQGYRQRQASPTSSSGTPAISLNTNSETSNTAAVDAHCLTGPDMNQITLQNYSLESEVFSPAVTLLECHYQNSQSITGVNPTVSYKVQLTNDANGLWNRQQNKFKSNSSYQTSSNYPAAFAVLNPVREIDQGTFYGYATGKYVELTYTPVSEGSGPLFDHGMQMLEKVLGN